MIPCHYSNTIMPQRSEHRGVTVLQTPKSNLKWKAKLYYGIGQSAESIKNFAMGTLLLLYYNQVLGLPGALSGIAVAIAVGFDAITDPAVGSWSDGFRHKLGRRHLFMLASILPLAATYFLLFWPPQGLSELGLFAWLTVFAVLSRTALTFFHVPYLALGAEMSMDYQERTQISVVRSSIGMAASLLIVMLTWNFIMVASPSDPSPQLSRSPYFDFALVSAIIMVVMMLISTLGTMSLIPGLTQTPADHPKFTLGRVYKDIFDALKNKAFFALFWGSLIFAVFMGVHVALAMHTKTFFWQLDTQGIEFVQYAGISGGLIGLVLIGPFHRIFDKRMTLIIGVFTYSIASTLPIALQLIGMMPQDPLMLLWLLVIAAFIGTAGILHSAVSGVSMMGDIADEHELHHGLRQEGVYFGSHNFALKCTTAVGSLVAGFALEIVNFPINAVPGEVSQEILMNYGLFSVVLVFMAGVGVWVFWPYDMSRERHAEIRLALLEKQKG
jgi:GPH family glycoside/pentoside/hexuronide:cation symporter